MAPGYRVAQFATRLSTTRSAAPSEKGRGRSVRKCRRAPEIVTSRYDSLYHTRIGAPAAQTHIRRPTSDLQSMTDSGIRMLSMQERSGNTNTNDNE